MFEGLESYIQYDAILMHICELQSMCITQESVRNAIKNYLDSETDRFKWFTDSRVKSPSKYSFPDTFPKGFNQDGQSFGSIVSQHSTKSIPGLHFHQSLLWLQFARLCSCSFDRFFAAAVLVVVVLLIGGVNIVVQIVGVLLVNCNCRCHCCEIDY